MKVLSVVGARPSFMKIALLHTALSALGGVQISYCAHGSDYDCRMSDIFFRQPGLPDPDVYLGVGSGSHVQQTARVMTGFEEVALGPHTPAPTPPPAAGRRMHRAADLP